MTQGQRFLDKCKQTQINPNPWPHQIIEDTFSQEIFEKLQMQCADNLNFPTNELIHIHPSQYLSLIHI